MEPFTTGKVSGTARRAYIESNPKMADAFEKRGNYYLMIAWQSQIDMARAMGRGAASGRGREPSPLDRKRGA